MRFLLICMFFAMSFAGGFYHGDIEGVWEIPEEIEGQSSIGKIFIENDKAFVYTFKYIFSEDSSERNIDNEESNAKLLKNKIFISNLEFDGKQWDNGKVYNPNDGEIYNVSAELSDDKNTLLVRISYDRFGFLGKTLQWSRVSNFSHHIPKHDGFVSLDLVN
ncbi:MAG: DUF2147 domain-containing protein [Helicobacteraceae bacterium]|nr:DUF2147 domain-containing protein [Helicobacteraceae bacterium]